MISKVDLERRRFLKAVGATALTYPFLRGLPSYAAAAGSAPTYMVLLFTPCGTVRPFWGATDASNKDVLFPAAGSAPTITTNFVFRDTLAPLAPVQNSVIILDGLANRAAQGSHEAGMASLWTGVTSTGGPATGPSVDQVIAANLNAGTPFPSIELMARSSADFTDREVKTRMIYNAAGAFMDPHDDPVEARNTFTLKAPAALSAAASARAPAMPPSMMVIGRLSRACASSVTRPGSRRDSSAITDRRSVRRGWRNRLG